MLWEMWYRKQAWDGMSPHRIFAKLMRGKRPTFKEPQPPPVLRKLIEGLWSQNYLERPDAREALHIFNSAIIPALNTLNDPDDWSIVTEHFDQAPSTNASSSQPASDLDFSRNGKHIPMKTSNSPTDASASNMRNGSIVDKDKEKDTPDVVVELDTLYPPTKPVTQSPESESNEVRSATVGNAVVQSLTQKAARMLKPKAQQSQGEEVAHSGGDQSQMGTIGENDSSSSTPPISSMTNGGSTITWYSHPTAHILPLRKKNETSESKPFTASRTMMVENANDLRARLARVPSDANALPRSPLSGSRHASLPESSSYRADAHLFRVAEDTRNERAKTDDDSHNVTMI